MDLGRFALSVVLSEIVLETSTKYMSRKGISPGLGLLSIRLTNSSSDLKVGTISGDSVRLASLRMACPPSKLVLLPGKQDSKDVARTQKLVKLAVGMSVSQQCTFYSFFLQGLTFFILHALE